MQKCLVKFCVLFEKSKNPNYQETVKNVLSKFKELDFYVEDNEDNFTIFKITNSFTENELHLAFCYNLLNQLIFYYEAIETTNKQEQAQSWKQVKKITAYLVKNEPDFVAKNPEVRQVYHRSKFLNPTLMGFLRKVKKVL